jgi:SAM-dependent methyltransferase
MSAKPLLADHEYLAVHRRVWAQKPVLRRIYHEQYYARLLAHRAALPGPTVEIGSGPGFMAEADPSVIRTDILASPYVQLAADAHALPLASASCANIVGLDILHHFNRPAAVLQEVARCLKPGGRFVLVEPWITPGSRLIYTYLHQEGCDMQAAPWLNDDQFSAGSAKQAFDGNPAIPYLLWRHGQQALAEAAPSLRLITLEKFSAFTYLLSMGFKPASFLPAPLYTPLYALERMTAPLWRDLIAIRALLVWEKTA